ncbi:hypothetical protein M153_2750003364 [Pseudoloma neurophilia]|uniref:Uncharacterized protein n=1 Tax=Pseudoloma neurophilia TaxID=146866 RepID=A0A0R0LYP0_9MICR|nr:hypothetical protein M153_2750003364 [Pseudoloma neurophilia]
MVDKLDLYKKRESLIHEIKALSDFPSNTVYLRDETTNKYESVKYDIAIRKLKEKIEEITLLIDNYE